MYNHSQVKFINCSIFQNEEIFKRYFDQMDEKRKSKITGCKFPKDRFLSLGVGYLASLLLEENGIENNVQFDDEGKPFLSNGCYISLSHSEEYAVAALSDKPIGVDIEKNKNDISNIVRRFYTDGEKLYVYEDSEKERERMYEVFSRKECMIKRDGFEDFRKLDTTLPKNNGMFISYPLEDYTFVIYCDSDTSISISEEFIEN